MNELFRIHENVITAFCQQHHIAFMALFGSILTPHFKDSSDIDILVKFDENHIPTLLDLIDMESELTALAGRQVDLKTPNELSPYFRDEVLAIAKIIYNTP